MARQCRSSIALTTAAALALAGCATTGANYRPIVDLRGSNPAAYETDLRECQAYATQTAGAGESAAAGAVGGAILGALLGIAAGYGSRNYQHTAGVGAVAGAAGAAAQGEQNQRDIIRRCMSGRGYNVLQ
ncbi:MAG: glycine zipper family protein [Burkholderiales bacterium]|nr:glycine zipper family protein [Burkholderiales bacterium]